MTEVNGAEAAPADDIRSALAAAIASQPEAEPAEKPVKASSKPAEEEGQGELELEAKEDDGFSDKDKEQQRLLKFAKEQEKEATDKKSAPEKPEGDKPVGKEPPINWTAADKATFKALPEPAQQFLLQRHAAMQADYTKKLQAFTALKTEYEPVDKFFEPHKDKMKAKGFTPRTLIEAWGNVENELAAGPERATKIVQGLVNGYKIPIEMVARALGLSARKPGDVIETVRADEPAPARVELPPELTQRLSGVEQFIAMEQRRRADEAAARIHESQTRVMSEIEQFKSATDDKGTLLHPHFQEVEDDMTALAEAANQRKQPIPSLDKLYETAVWANPSTREKIRTAETQAAERKRADEARAKAAAAKKAGASVTGAPGVGQAPTGRRASDLSLREQLLEAAEESRVA